MPNKYAKLWKLLDINEACADTPEAYRIAKQLTKEVQRAIADLLVKSKKKIYN